LLPSSATKYAPLRSIISPPLKNPHHKLLLQGFDTDGDLSSVHTADMAAIEIMCDEWLRPALVRTLHQGFFFCVITCIIPFFPPRRQLHQCWLVDDANKRETGKAYASLAAFPFGLAKLVSICTVVKNAGDFFKHFVLLRSSYVLKQRAETVCDGLKDVQVWCFPGVGLWPLLLTFQ
jgi:hypothetical protein